jgi:hypothetical protein
MWIYTFVKIMACRGGDAEYQEKVLFSTPVLSVAQRPLRKRLHYQDKTSSSKVMEEGLVVLFHRCVIRMLTRVVPGLSNVFGSGVILEATGGI